jgi:hypothetical protein
MVQHTVLLSFSLYCIQRLGFNKTQRFEIWFYFHLQVKGGHLWGHLYKLLSDLNHINPTRGHDTFGFGPPFTWGAGLAQAV